METKKKCDRCDGQGEINIKKMKAAIDYHKSKEENDNTFIWHGDTCPVCIGKGYLELKWI